MENSQATYVNGVNPIVQEPCVSEDHYWKALYSHSYTALFRCENCGNEFDIDGWFYKFDNIVCPKCQTEYSGFFGRVLPSSQAGCIDLELFDGQKAQISLTSKNKTFPSMVNHIILVLSSNIKNKQSKLWGIIDYSEAKPRIQLLSQIDGSAGKGMDQRGNGKSKSLLSMIFGIF